MESRTRGVLDTRLHGYDGDGWSDVARMSAATSGTSCPAYRFPHGGYRLLSAAARELYASWMPLRKLYRFPIRMVSAEALKTTIQRRDGCREPRVDGRRKRRNGLTKSFGILR